MGLVSRHVALSITRTTIMLSLTCGVPLSTLSSLRPRSHHSQVDSPIAHVHASVMTWRVSFWVIYCPVLQSDDDKSTAETPSLTKVGPFCLRTWFAACGGSDDATWIG